MPRDEAEVRALLESPETCATVIHAIIRSQYGEEAYGWDPLTVAMELKDDFKIDVPSQVLDRWSAIQTLMTSDAFFTRLDAFLGICNTFSSGEPFFSVFDPVTVEEAAWALVEAALNREFLPFDYQIQQYCRTILKQDGYNESDFPPVFAELLERSPDAADIRKQLGTGANKTIIDTYIDEELADLVRQFNKVPHLSNLDEVISRMSLNEYMNRK